MDRNKFVETEINPNDMGHIESTFALGNGYLGMRGTYDEEDTSIGQECGMYINGIFETEPFHHLWNCKGFAKNEQYTVNLPDWRIIEVYIDGVKGCYSNSTIKNHQRTLCMDTGRIERSFDIVINKKTVHIESIRIVNIKMPHSAEIKYTVTALDFDGEVSLVSKLIKNTPINGKYPTHTKADIALENGISICTETNNSKMKAACTVAEKISAAEFNLKNENTTEYYKNTYSFNLQKGQSVSIEKYASFYSDEDKIDDIMSASQKEAKENLAKGFQYFADIQAKYWENHWENGDIEIFGSKSDDMAVKFSNFHLRQQLPSINNASIGATGLTGANYSGKVFWDTEMYLMPYFNYTDPKLCEGLLMYRYKILDKARERAGQLGGVGALYSWCSIDGEETSVVFEASTAEYHINSDIAFAIARHYKSTGDRDFMYNYMAEILFETAKFMAHRGSFVEAYDGRFCINAVCGPDEYACGVNNNCYTNFMVQFHLRYALEIYEEMKGEAPIKLIALSEKIGITNEELKLWKDAADKMYYKVNERYGIYEQDDHFVYNDSVDMNTIPKNYDIRNMFHPLDLWRMQVLKQADVVLLNFVLGDKFTLEEKKLNYDYYEPKTNHGSSLSAAVHSIMANEIGYYDDAYSYFKSAAFMDIDDYKKNTSGGLHMACLGSVWMTVINGFLGMRDYNSGLKFNINLPKEWEGIKCRLLYRGSLIEINATKEKNTFTLLSGDGCEFEVNGERAVLNKDTKEFCI